MWLHSEDSYLPSDILAHVKHTTPRFRKTGIKEDLPDLDLDNLEILNGLRGRVALTSREDPLTHPAWQLGVAPDPDTGVLPNATACAVVLVDKVGDGHQVDAFYFYFYSYDEGANITQVMEPIDSLIRGPEAESGMHFGNHIGDWEVSCIGIEQTSWGQSSDAKLKHNMVRFRDGIPVGIYYSQHEGGSAYSWDDSHLEIQDDRVWEKSPVPLVPNHQANGTQPLVYSALGSHANYAAEGFVISGSPHMMTRLMLYSEQVHNTVLIDYCDAGKRWDPVLSAYFYRYHHATKKFTTLSSPASPSPPSHNYTSWLYYTGRWGDFRYPDSDPRQLTVPKFNHKRFVTGPTGPRSKQLIRKNLLPDHRHAVTWKEWAVHIFMMLYPWAIKGWRKWFSLLVLLAVLVGGALASVVLVRKLKRRFGGVRLQGGDYQRVGLGEIALDDWVRDEEALLSSFDDSDSE